MATILKKKFDNIKYGKLKIERMENWPADAKITQARFMVIGKPPKNLTLPAANKKMDFASIVRLPVASYKHFDNAQLLNYIGLTWTSNIAEQALVLKLQKQNRKNKLKKA